MEASEGREARARGRAARRRGPADILAESTPELGLPPGAGRSETISRLVWAIPLVVFAITIIVLGGLVFSVAMAAFAIAAMSEYFRMTIRAKPLIPVAFLGAIAIVMAAHFGDQYHMILATAACFPAMFIAAAARGDRRHIAYSIAITVFAIVWIAIPFAHAALLRDLPLHGAALLVDVLVATFVADTAAYAGGRLFGRHPLAPGLSPNKTLEGFAFGFVGGTMGFWFAGLYQDWLPGIDALLMGAAIALLAPVGDLFQSMIKRDLDVKDTGTIFGPHGGVLDRLDAVLFTVVAGYYLSIAFVY